MARRHAERVFGRSVREWIQASATFDFRHNFLWERGTCCQRLFGHAKEYSAGLDTRTRIAHGMFDGPLILRGPARQLVRERAHCAQLTVSQAPQDVLASQPAQQGKPSTQFDRFAPSHRMVRGRSEHRTR